MINLRKYIKIGLIILVVMVFIININVKIVFLDPMVRSFVFDISLQVNPYIGPHILVGTDNIDFTIEGNGRVNVKKFEHIKSYDLPPT
ncbi:DUF3888 domain-containing protein [Clostridium sp. UBA7503]|uniref:DUF3888 domain-containing protein n=1 Tax=Clostridium sp. UBA7503 TaxID=1946377 RepID=UPI003216290C